MIEVNNRTRSEINIELVKEVTTNFCKIKKIKKDISIAFVGDTTIQKLNKDYRGKDKVTDILSFQDDDPEFLGEIVIDYTQIKRQTKKYSKNTKEELIYILIHGLLHLIGMEDESEKGALKMKREGDRLIEKIASF